MQKTVLLTFAGTITSFAFVPATAGEMGEDDLNERLLQACDVADLSLVKQLLAAGADIGATDSQGQGPLHYAASEQNGAEIVKYLIQNGADVNSRSTEKTLSIGVRIGGSTPLHVAVGNRRSDIAIILLRAGASVNAQNADGATPLHNAASLGDASLVSALITRRAKADVKDRDGRTPLHKLMAYGPSDARDVLKVAKLLIAAGASLQVKDNAGTTPIDDCSKPVVRKYLLHDLSALTPFDALEIGDSVLLSRFVKSRADANLKNNEGYSLLHIASSKGLIESVTFLVEQGADMDSVFSRERLHKAPVGVTAIAFMETPLVLALKDRHWDVAKYLIEKGANVNIVGKTTDFVGLVMFQGEIVPVVFAARFSQNELVSLMTAKKADVNLAGSDGNTAIMEAAKKGNIALARILVGAGASVSAKNKEGLNARKIAELNGQSNMVKWLDSMRR